MKGPIDKKVGFLIFKIRTMVLNDSDYPNI
jgi:hypothetical protein